MAEKCLKPAKIKFPGVKSLASSTLQPFLFQQYTVREFLTPTKNGNISVKEESFNTCYVVPSMSLFKKVKPRLSPPLKRIKFDQKDNRRANKCVSHSAKIKEVKKLHWKYIFLVSLVPLLILMPAIYFINPTQNNDTGVDEFITNEYISDDNIITSQTCENLRLLHDTLNQRIFGQEAAITSLVKILDDFLNKGMARKKQMPVILISGPSDEEKLVILSIVSNTFPPPGKTELVFPQISSSVNLILNKFSENCLNLILVNIVPSHSIQDAIKWTQNVFSEATWQNKEIIVILVHNVQVWNEKATDITSSEVRVMAEAFHERLISHGLDSHLIHLAPVH